MKTITKETQEKLAKELFNTTWGYIDMDERTLEDDIQMISSAHASCLLWSKCGTMLNVARGQWQISRVYSLLGHGNEALYHANYSLQICIDNNYGGFDLPFGYEAVARAYAVLKDEIKMKENIKLALEHAEKIEDKGDREYTISEINNIKM